MNIAVNKLVSTALFTLLPFTIMVSTAEAGATTEIKQSLTKEKSSTNKKRLITCDSFSRSKLLEKADKYQKTIVKASQDYNVSAHLITAVITVESCFRPKVRSSSGAAGLMQLMPATAKRFGTTDRYDTTHNIKAGTQYLRFLLKKFDGNIQLAAAAYNAGEGAVDRYNGIPPYKQTQTYVRRVLNAYRTLSATPKRAGSLVKRTRRTNTRSRAWYIKQYERKRSIRVAQYKSRSTPTRHHLNLTTHEMRQAKNLLRHEEMKPALSFKQFL